MKYEKDHSTLKYLASSKLDKNAFSINNRSRQKKNNGLLFMGLCFSPSLLWSVRKLVI